jgi:L-cysteine:1D-myo-inositol 2-amino-2-deoxy-alpha-D-glucopyranoside ligase
VKLFNTQTGTTENFTKTHYIKLYTCGITPYDTTHLGHAFTYFVSDVLIRFLESKGKKVTYVQNVTDIDDDILKKAAEERESWRLLGNRWTIHFIEDMQTLNMRPPDHFPRATAVIPEIISVAQKLLNNGFAYEQAGNVYFDIHSWPDFGKLSGLDFAEMLPIANERGNNPNDPHKRDPLDFVLWQAKAPGEPAWESPWGDGRPGWHIECSTMATRLLGETIDIHSGGEDLLFPHHECEIAQIEPVTGVKPFVRCWLHVAMVHHEGKKMSKSLGNLVMVRDLLQEYSANAIRIYLAMHHYRNPWEHSWFELFQAKALDQQIQRALAAKSHPGKITNPFPFQRRFQQAMENDLDTPETLVVIQEIVKNILVDSQAKRDVTRAQDQLRKFCEILGLQLDYSSPSGYVLRDWDKHLEKFIETNEKIDYRKKPTHLERIS